MNSGTLNDVIRALSTALRRTHEYVGMWDGEFARAVRLLVLESVLSKLDNQYPTSEAAKSVWGLSGLKSTSFEAIRRLFLKHFNDSLNPQTGAVSVETAAAVLDGVSIDIGLRTQRAAGAVFTPPTLASFLAAEVVGSDTGWSVLSNQLVIDPACGAGSLLLATLAEGRKRIDATRLSRTRARHREWAMGHVIGVDLDPDAANTAACLLGLALGVSAEEVLGAGMVRVADSLLESDNKLDSHSYDKVIMNPPWIRTKDLNSKGYSKRLRADSRYPLTTRDGKGDLDLYQFFLEMAFALAADRACIGFIVPGSFLRSSRAARLRHLYLTAGHFVRLDEFWNQERIFPIHSMFRFVTGIFEKGIPSRAIDARFRLASVEDVRLQDAKRLSPHLFVNASNGTARPIPEVTTRSGLSLYRKITARQPALGSSNNPWSKLLSFKREFDMTGDRHRFIESCKVQHDSNLHGCLRPVYEGRMVHQFDSAAKTYHSGKGRRAEWAIWLPGRQFRSQFYVDESNIPTGLIGHVSRPRAGFCDVTGHANERTVLAAMIPAAAVCGNKVPTLQIDDLRLHFLWVAIANSFVVDWYVRRSVTTSLNYHYLLATPFPWVEPNSSVGRSLHALSTSLTFPRSSDRSDLLRRAQIRANIDCHIAMLFGLDTPELNEIFNDFPLLDRGQPVPTCGPSTVTRDFVVARHARMLGETDSRAEARVQEAQSAGAIPYVPGELAAELIAGASIKSTMVPPDIRKIG